MFAQHLALTTEPQPGQRRAAVSGHRSGRRLCSKGQERGSAGLAQAPPVPALATGARGELQRRFPGQWPEEDEAGGVGAGSVGLGQPGKMSLCT